MKNKIAKELLLLMLCFLPQIGISQLRMDLELLGGVTFNGNKYNYSDDSYSFQLKNGSSMGIGFDIWMPKDYAI